jgi:hypothetical protein
MTRAATVLDNLSRWRICRFCGATEPYYADGVYRMVHYSVRSFAHWTCLVSRKGEAFAVASIPAWRLALTHRGAP